MTRLVNRLSNLFLLCLGIFSLLSIIASSFQCRYDASLWIWMLALCITLWAASTFRRGFWIGMPAAAVLLFLAYRIFGHNPVLQLQDLIDHISGAFYSHILYPGESYPYLNAVSSHSLILLFVGFLLAAYLSTALHSRSLRITLALLETVPIFTACAMVNGTMPGLASAGMLLFWFLLLVGGVGYHPDGSLGRTVLCCVLPISLLLGGLLIRYDPAKYEYSARDQELAERFEKLSRYFDLFTGKSKEEAVYASDPDQPTTTQAPRSQFLPSWDTNDNSMQLETEFDMEHAELRLLQVRAQSSGRLYLRTRSFGDYSGTGWRPAEELSSGSSLPFTAFAAELSPDGIKRELDVRSFLDLSALCIPYYAAVSSGSDVCVTAEDQTSYRVSYIDFKGSVDTLSLPAEAAAAESRYRSHAHSVYTRLPEATRAAALHLCEDAGIRGDDPNLVQTIADFVSESGEYDLQTEPYPSTDYAIYFLTEAHRGYCIHYATAACVLYRSFGIPARVTEGFAVETRAGFYTDVLARDAHAWVEVYQDGLGWIPMEVTARGGTATSLPDATPSPSPLPEPEQQPSPSPDPASGMEQQGGGGGPGPTETPEPEPVNEPGSGFPWWLLLILPALVVLFFLWYGLARARFVSQLKNPDGRRAVIACWRYAGKAAAFGSEIPAVIRQKAEKVTFSPHNISQEELEQCIAELNALIESIYPTLSPLGKFRFRFLRGLK